MTQRIPLKIPCPPSCSCSRIIVHNWHHKSCSSQSFINIKGDISCEDGCGEYFIQYARFQCPENMNYQSFQHATQFLMALGLAMQQNTDFDLTDQQLVQFICQLNMEVVKRWLRSQPNNKQNNEHFNNISFINDIIVNEKKSNNGGQGISNSNQQINNNFIFKITNSNFNNVVFQGQEIQQNTRNRFPQGNQQQNNFQQQYPALKQDKNKQKSMIQYSSETLHIIKTIIIIISQKPQDIQRIFAFIYQYSQPLKQQIILELELIKQRFNSQGKIQLVLNRIQVSIHRNEELNLYTSDFQIDYLQEEQILNQVIIEDFQ